MTTTIADYLVVEPLAEGGHGRFYLAVPPARLAIDADRVVIKVLTGVGDDNVRRITRELRLFASIDSEHLVRLYDAGQEDDQFFYSMEHLPLGSLDVNDDVDVNRRIAAVAAAARAAHALHESGVAHRDIRPGNVLLAEDGGRLADLGLAHLITGGGSVTSMAPMASVPYSDPAILLGERPSRATDIYSLGTTLHAAAAGHGVHADLDERDPLLAVRTVLRRKPHIDAALPEPIASLVAACIDPDPALRPATAAEVADAITDAVASIGGMR